ncbi:uncharacterized protein SRS1_15865 [Sporisorium reilianum f. sp. reilianum]|uniref:Uncharacterized protein n=1 Tax=Sporisorium reilianum f. sp. reilianum TaxID=72559 RepID=A0A2N8UJT9_9BASI|nr:uncharacterized protein SRS1_15865 [Sporisorium reilianum f. sp. reilianum]
MPATILPEVPHSSPVFVMLEALGIPEVDRPEPRESAHKVMEGYKLIQNPLPFTLMVTVHVMFKMTPAQLKHFKDDFLATRLVRGNARVDVHKVIIQTVRDDLQSDRVVQYDLDMESSSLDALLEDAHTITSHPNFDSMWKQAGAKRRDENEMGCHTKPVESHGCSCRKHTKAWTQKLILLRCSICKPAPNRFKEES